jgi:hypothetical protein
MFKELVSKALKFIGASVGVLVAAYTVGWSGAITLHSMFKAEKAEAEMFVTTRVDNFESKIMAIRKADMEGIQGKFDILIAQTNLIIAQNYKTRKVVIDKIEDEK